MAKATTRLTNDALAFLTERHLAMLTTLRSNNSPHVVAVGFTFDPKTHIARVITTGGSQKAVNAQDQGVAVLSQVDGARWLSLEGKASVNTEAEAVLWELYEHCPPAERVTALLQLFELHYGEYSVPDTARRLEMFLEADSTDFAARLALA